MVKVNLMELTPTQPIRGMDIDYVNKLSENMRKGSILEKPIVYKLNGTYYIVDGHHRVLSYISTGTTIVECIEIFDNNNEYRLKIDDAGKLKRSDIFDWEDLVSSLRK